MTTPSTSSLLTCLSQSIPPTRIVTPTNPLFPTLARVYNTRFNRLNPLRLILLPETSSEIADAINCVRKFNIPIRVKGGGHSYEGYSMAKDALLIDLRRMDDVAIFSTSNKLVDISAGAWLGKIYYELGKLGWTIPGGRAQLSVSLVSH